MPGNPDPKALALFWQFIAERHNIYWRRAVLSAPLPWTTDEVLASGHFTNVYRELDPGTRWLMGFLARHPGQPLGHRLLNVGAYRLAFHERSMAALGWLEPRKLKLGGGLAKQLAAIPNPFTGAYMVSNFQRKDPKTVVIADVIGRMAETAGPLAHLVRAAASRAEVWQAMMDTWYGVGPFVAFQTLVDLSYPGVCDHDLRPHIRDNDGFAATGSGSTRGLRLLWPDMKKGQQDEAMAWLAKAQAPALGAMLGGWAGGEGPRRLSRANIQNCCCEFSKYMGARGGTGRLRRRFDARVARTRDLDAGGHGGQLEML